MPLWFRDKSDGEWWEYREGTREEYPELVEPFGNDRLAWRRVALINRETRTVTVRKDSPWRKSGHGLSLEYRNESALHETCHRLLTNVDRSGFTDEQEERLISELSPRLYPLIYRHGFRWPARK